MSLTIVDAFPLYNELTTMGFVQVTNPRDKSLALPHLGFLKQLFEWQRDKNPAYKPEVFDCDDFSMSMVLAATLRLAEIAPNAGHSILMCDLRLIEGCDLNGVTGSHSTNIVKTADAGWVFFEPQNGRTTDANKAIAECVGSLDFVRL